MDNVQEVQKKKEYSELPESIIVRALELCKGDVKETRAFLRKYYGIFLTNKVLKGVGPAVLASHYSSKKRDYPSFYRQIFSKIDRVCSICDLGAGVNGYSYKQLEEEIGPIDYLGLEGVGQLVGATTEYFTKQRIPGQVKQVDLTNTSEVMNYVTTMKKPCVGFLFQVVDALEELEQDSSKKLITVLMKELAYLVITLPTESIGKRKKFRVQRNWMVDFLKEHYTLTEDYETAGERILVITNKKS